MASEPDLELFVPGRVCLFGEHSDWAGSFRRFNSQLCKGYTVVVGTNQGLHARVRRHPTSLVMATTTEKGERLGPVEIPMAPRALLQAAQEGGFWSYAAGVAYKIMTDYRVSGVAIDNYRTTLPLKKGLSSSAAVCVLVARAFNRVYDLKMTTRGEMEYAYQGEIMTPSRCGRMDQACAFGARPVLMTYDGEFLDVDTIRVPRPIHLLLVDLCAKKDTVEILAKLQAGFPFAQTEEQRGVQRLLGPVNQDITARAVRALQEGDAAQLGALMREAQRQFDEHGGRACPAQLIAPVLHKVLEYPAIQPHIHGGKGVGAGGDGTAQLLCLDAEARVQVARIIEEELGMPTLELTIDAAAPITRAVIPAAGFGADLFPATKAVRVELFPVVDADGVAKPAIVLNVEELVAAGVAEVVIVVQPADLPAFTRVFKERVSPALWHRLSDAGRRYAKHVEELGRRVKLVVQERQEGLGHAVLCAREAVGEQPFLLVLGDHIYKSTHPDRLSCAQQLLAEFQRQGVPVLGLKHTAGDAVSSFGAVTGAWQEHAAGDAALLSVAELAEKPTREYAEEHLKVPRVPEGQFLTMFGMYALTPAVFGVLEDMVAHSVREGGDFQLTSALDRLRRQQGLMGLVVEGHRFDLGRPEHYFRTLTAFHDGSASD